MNCIDFNPALNQIAMSVRGNSEVWIIDHSTTTAQSAGHAGGVHGKGGDLLYRWGNPLTYGAGTVTNQKFFEQHDVEWIKPDCPGAGNFMCFNNGVNRNYSSIDEITPPVDISGNYNYVSGSAYDPTSLTWTYVATPPQSLFAHDISGAQRLQNGNTLIDDGPLGSFSEVSPAGDIVWKYINPVDNTGPLMQGDSIPHDPTHPDETMNSVFRVYRYPPDYAAFDGKDLTPGDFIELYPTGIGDQMNQSPLIQCYPNPFKTRIRLTNTTGTEYMRLTDIMGHLVWSGTHIEHNDYTTLAPGLYFLRIEAQNSGKTIKIVKQ